MPKRVFPIQTKMQNFINKHPVEIFKWGGYPDHFKIEMPHTHDFDELLFFTKGGGIHEIDFKEHNIEKHSIHFVPRSSVHFMKRAPYSDGFTLAFDSSYLERNLIHSFNNPLYSPGFNNQSFVINMDRNVFLEVLSVFEYLEQQIAKTKGYFQEKCFLLSLELMLNSIASETEQQRKGEILLNMKNPISSKFMDLVKVHVYETTSVAWYANALYVSPAYLSNLIKAELGVSPKQYITSLLLHSVKRHLFDTKECIKMIAFNHNMGLASLGKLFKKNVGYTMSEYRCQKKGNFD